jgi:hypothetical protein
MFTHLMRESRIYGHNKGHLDSCSKCKEFKAEFERNLAKIDVKKFNEMIEYEKKQIKAYKEDAAIYLGYKLQSKYYIKKNYPDDIHLSVPYNIIINKDNITSVLLEKLDILPDKFVIKKNKLSGYTVIVDKAGKISYQEQKYKYSTGNLYEILTTMLRYDYDKNPEKEETDQMDLFIEEYIPVNEEFKFHCIHGKVIMIEHYLVGEGLYNNKWYTRDWHEIDLIGRDDPYPYIVYPDKELKRYVEVAEKIAKDIDLDYIRVDAFTSKDDKLFFGELSHSPNAFHNNYTPLAFDELLYKFYTKEIPVDDVANQLLPFLIYNKKIKINESNENIISSMVSMEPAQPTQPAQPAQLAQPSFNQSDIEAQIAKLLA